MDFPGKVTQFQKSEPATGSPAAPNGTKLQTVDDHGDDSGSRLGVLPLAPWRDVATQGEVGSTLALVTLVSEEKGN